MGAEYHSNQEKQVGGSWKVILQLISFQKIEVQLQQGLGEKVQWEASLSLRECCPRQLENIVKKKKKKSVPRAELNLVASATGRTWFSQVKSWVRKFT